MCDTRQARREGALASKGMALTAVQDEEMATTASFGEVHSPSAAPGAAVASDEGALTSSLRGAAQKRLRLWWRGLSAGSDLDESDLDSTTFGSEEEHMSDWATSPTDSPRCCCEPTYDVTANAAGEPVLLPIGGGEPIEVSGLCDDAIVTIRVFRFIEDRNDEARPWEQELRNVNSGSLVWLPVHLEPKMHSMSGAKYGRRFTLHYVRIFAKHFRSGYHMAEEGACPLAKSFGATSAARLVSGEVLPEAYFWFVSPDRRGNELPQKDVADEENLHKHGWQHVRREGPFDGDAFLAAWRQGNCPLDCRGLQEVLAAMPRRSSL